MKRVFIIHGWGWYPQKDWLPWAKTELENKGFEVKMPEMPDSMHPKIKTWVGYLSDVVGEVQEGDIFIGHSIGCSTILRYLGTLPDNKKISKAIMVAPWAVSLSNLDDTEDEEIAKPWLETPIDTEKVKTKSSRFIAIFSDNDPYVPLEENRKFFEEKLGAEIIVEHNQGHFSAEDGVIDLPSLLELVER